MWQTERGKVSSGCGLWPWVSESCPRASCASTSPIQPGGQPGSHLQTERASQPWAAAHLPRQLRTFSTGDHTVTHRGRGDPGQRGWGGGGVALLTSPSHAAPSSAFPAARLAAPALSPPYQEWAGAAGTRGLHVQAQGAPSGTGCPPAEAGAACCLPRAAGNEITKAEVSVS